VKDVLHIGAKNVKNCKADAHHDMNSQVFEAWFKNSLLPNLPKSSYIIMDNASYHSRLQTKIPNSSWKKNYILEFMNTQKIEVQLPLTKCKLLEIIKEKKFEKTYVIDGLAMEAGHTVIWLPPYYCILNPIELMWHEFKVEVRKNNVNPHLCAEVVDVVRKSIQKIPSIHWANCCKHVMKIEQQLREKFKNFPTINKEDFEIPLNESSSDEFEELFDCT